MGWACGGGVFPCAHGRTALTLSAPRCLPGHRGTGAEEAQNLLSAASPRRRSQLRDILYMNRQINDLGIASVKRYLDLLCLWSCCLVEGYSDKCGDKLSLTFLGLKQEVTF